MIKVGDVAGHQDEIERPRPDHLIRDLDLAARGVMGIRLHAMAPDLPCCVLPAARKCNSST
jgi:hypothetical protein